jgi:hypothetical protein
MNIQELQDKVRDYAADCSDATATLRGLSFGTGRALIRQEADVNAVSGEPMRVAGVMNDWAINQICGRLDAPAGWLYKENHCPEALAAEILNKLTGIRDDAKLLLRYKGNTVRAVLSDQYTVFDNHEMVDLVTKAVDTMGIKPSIVRVQADDDLSAYVMFPDVTVAHDPRDSGEKGNLHPAMHIRNSERGGGTAKICGAVFSSFCQNGMIVGWKANDIMAVRHRFINHDGMLVTIADAIGSALELSVSAAEAFAQSVNVRIPEVSLGGLVDGWVRRYGLSVENGQNWLAAITAETARNERQNDPRLFDVINGATLVAQQYQPAEAIAVESMMGDLLNQYVPVRSENNEQ